MASELFADSSEYLAFAERFFTLTERVCQKAKADIQTLGPDDVIHRLPALISLVNCVGYLRGQDGVFLDERPATSTSNIQGSLYKMEDQAEKLLQEIIDQLLVTESTKERYKERLMNYFVRSRSGEKPSSTW